MSVTLVLMNFYKSRTRLGVLRREPRGILLLLGVLCVLLWGVNASAHHGNAAYDPEHPKTIKGTVTEFVWSNPHCQIYLDVKDDSGKVVHWSVESQSPGILKRNGWNKDIVKPGDEITVTLVAAKNGAPVGFSGEEIGRVVLPDGKTLRMNER